MILIGFDNRKNKVVIPASDLNTHAFICGVTGSGKTVLGKIFIEEMASSGIPSILFDLKGDLSSLAIPIINCTPDEFEPWIEVKKGEDKETVSNNISKKHKDEIIQSGFTIQDIINFRKKVKVKIFTPGSRKGIPLGFSPIPIPPDDPDLLEDMSNFAAENLINLAYDKSSKKNETEKAYLKALVEELWRQKEPIEGIEGIAKIVYFVENPPMNRIGARDVEKFLPPNERDKLANKLNAILVTKSQILEGVRVDNIDAILDDEGDKKTVISIINLAESRTFEEKAGIVSQVAYSLYNWMKNKGTSDEPRLLVYLDEIGGGGGREAFFPSSPYNPVSKSPLQLLLRQGRAFGLSCIFATQNPGDIDYRALSNCQTWVIGKLSTERDRKKILEGITDAELGGNFKEKVQNQITSLNTGEFILRTKNNDVIFFKERWLLSYHKTLSFDELERVCQINIKDVEYKTQPIIEEVDETKAIELKEEIIIKKETSPNEAIPSLVLHTIQNSCIIKQEVLDGNIHGVINLSNLSDNTALEGNAEDVFRNTYLTNDILNTLDSIQKKLQGKDKRGAYLFLGNYGVGKSHILLFLYHFFKNPKFALSVLQNQRFQIDNYSLLSTLDDPIVLASALHTENRNFIWEIIYEKLGKSIKPAFIDYPKKGDIAQLIGDKPFIIILDELEGFLKAIGDETRRHQNRMFIQNLTELSYENNNIFVFISLLGKDKETSVIFERVNPYRKLLSLSLERSQILHFRLFDKINQDKKEGVIDSYINFYKSKGILPGRLRELKDNLQENFPIHPEFLEVFYRKVSQHPDWNQTRGLLYLMATILREKYKTRELLLLSDIDPENDDLSQLDRDLVLKAKKDIEQFQDTPLSQEIIMSVLVHSLGEQHLMGASREDLEIAVLRSSINYNQFITALNTVSNESAFVWMEKNKWFIKRKENIISLINYEARKLLSSFDELDNESKRNFLLPVFRNIKNATKLSNTIIYPFEMVDDNNEFKIVISLDPLTNLKIDEIINSLRYQNSIVILYFEESLLDNNKIMETLAKLQIARTKEGEVSDDERPQVSEIISRIENEIKEDVNLLKGRLIRFIYDEESRTLTKKPESIELSQVLDRINSIFDLSRIKTEFEQTLQKHQDTGLSINNIFDDWTRIRGKPLLTDEIKEKVRNIIEDLSIRGKITKDREGGREIIRPVSIQTTPPLVGIGEITEAELKVEEINIDAQSYAEAISQLEEKLSSSDFAEGIIQIELLGENISGEIEKIKEIITNTNEISFKNANLIMNLQKLKSRDLGQRILTKLPRTKGRVSFRLRLEKK